MMSLPQKKFPHGTKMREQKAELLAERVFKFFIHLGTTIMLFWVLKNSNFLQKNLLGDHENIAYFKNYPCQKIPNFMDDLYIIKLSYHLYEQMYTLIFQRERRDFPEIMLHHFLTLVLILFSYSVNFMPMGAVVMLIHDVTDLVVSVFKLCVDICSHTVQFCVYGVMFVSWIYFRLYIFPVYIIQQYYL